MGVTQFLASFFGGGRNVVAETVGIFRENSEAGAQRQADYAQAALTQYAAEFQIERKGLFDRMMDGLNRLPRPLIVIATFMLFASAMFDPIWFAVRMQGLALVPEPLWWLSGTIVTFYFGGRFQIKAQDFKAAAQQSAEVVPQVLENIARIRELGHTSPGVADTGTDAVLSIAAIELSENDAVREWQEAQTA